MLVKWPWGNYVQVNNHNPEFEIHKTFYFGPNLIRSVKRLTEEICDCKIVKKVTGFWLLYIKMTVHIKQLTGKMHVGGWTSGRSLTACTKFYCNNVMLQLRLKIYFGHKTNQTYMKCHMHITFDCQQMICSSLYLLPL